jgi:hypothetical protein
MDIKKGIRLLLVVTKVPFIIQQTLDLIGQIKVMGIVFQLINIKYTF